MVKFNCGGGGLVRGLQAQVDRLAEVMKTSADIRCLHVLLNDGSKSRTSSFRGQMYPILPRNSLSHPQAVLNPFMKLKGLREVIIEGSVTEEYVHRLEKYLTRTGVLDI